MAEKTGQPRPLTGAEVHELLDVIASEHGLRFELAGELAGGDGPGAWELASAEGPAVLKMLLGRDVTAELEQRGRALDVLRGRGYPAPRSVCVGTIASGTYLVQERLSGEPLSYELTPDQVEEIVRLHALHADIGVDLPGETWPLPVTRPTLEGADGFCVIETMRAYAPETDAFLTELQDMTRTHADDVSRTGDIVHLDFTFANVLGSNGLVTGVIDWEAATVGDMGFDLATFAYYVFFDGVLRRALLARAAGISGVGALRVYFAHLMFRQTEWSTRFYDEDRVRFYLDHSRTILTELDAL
jgi:aminoglycoside phosphotransferase (APT) family kinase protein